MVKVPILSCAVEICKGQKLDAAKVPLTPILPKDTSGIIYTSAVGNTESWNKIAKMWPVEMGLEQHLQIHPVAVTVPSVSIAAEVPCLKNSGRINNKIAAWCERVHAMAGHMHDTCVAQAFTGAIHGTRSDMSGVTKSLGSTGILKQCSASQLRSTNTLVTRKEKLEQTGSGAENIQKTICYGDSAHELLRMGQEVVPTLKRTLPEVWEDDDMGALQDTEGTTWSRANAKLLDVKQIMVQQIDGDETRRKVSVTEKASSESSYM